MAIGLVEVVEYPIIRAVAPGVTALLGSGLAHWAETLIDSAIKLVAILVSWWLQMVISSIYSALRGGRMVADGLCELIVQNGWEEYAERLPGVSKPFDPNTSYLDEAVQYTLAALGVAYQLGVGFQLPFPVNIVLLPLEIVEWVLRWQVTFGVAPTSAQADG